MCNDIIISSGGNNLKYLKIGKKVRIAANLNCILVQYWIKDEVDVCFGLLLYVQGNSYGHVGTVSSPNHTFFLGKLEQAVFVCFVALRPKSTAMVIAGRSVHLTTFFPGQA